MNGFQEAENPRSVFFFYEYFVYLARQPALKTLLDVFPFDLYFDFFFCACPRVSSGDCLVQVPCCVGRWPRRAAWTWQESRVFFALGRERKEVRKEGEIDFIR